MARAVFVLAAICAVLLVGGLVVAQPAASAPHSQATAALPQRPTVAPFTASPRPSATATKRPSRTATATTTATSTLVPPTATATLSPAPTQTAIPYTPAAPAVPPSDPCPAPAAPPCVYPPVETVPF